MKKILALLLSLLSVLSLCACGETKIQGYEEPTAEAIVEQAETTETTVETQEEAQTAETETAGLDWAAAYARHEPDEVVLRVDGDPITWQELFYEIANVTAGLQSAAGTAITDWNVKIRDSAGNEAVCGDYVLSYAMTVLGQYHCVYSHLTQQGVTLSAEGQQAVEDVRQNLIDNYFDGDEEQFLSNLEALFCSEELYDWFNMVDQLYSEGFAALYGENGANLTDEEVLEYGSEYSFVQIRQIYIYPEETDSGEDETAADTSVLDSLAAQLGAAVNNEAREELFDMLYEQYNENEDLDIYGPSRAVNTDDVSIGSVDEGVYNAALALEEYGYACVTAADGAAVLVMRVPLQADAPVYYETLIGQLCDLRYYAATQRYLLLINGDDGWIATAEVAWEDDFIGFNLVDAFAAPEEETATEAAETVTEAVEASTEAASSAEPDA